MGTMDLNKTKESLPEANENKKCCADCRTTRTPLWRGGPAGPKSLCNACGIRYRKKMISVVRLSKGTERKRERINSHATTITNSTTSASAPATAKNDTIGGRDRDFSEALKVRLMALGEEVLSHRSSSSSPTVVKKQRCRRRRKLGEEEQAAVLLMALSCGSVFA